MDYGAHLSLIDFTGKGTSLKQIIDYSETAERLGYKTLCANDHLLFSKPWMDGPTALASVIASTSSIGFATTVSLPVVRGPVAMAKTLAAIDILSEGRLTVGVGPGSSQSDYAAVGIPFEERWKRLDEAVETMRALWSSEGPRFKGSFYSTEGIEMRPFPRQQPGLPIWLGSWGSPAGLRRVARLGDGWLASAYNTTPEIFQEGRARLDGYLGDAEKDPGEFPDAIATMFCYVTEDQGKADRVIRDVIVPAINRPEEELRERLPVGSAEECAEKLAAYQAAGAQSLYLWPVDDEVRQLELFQERVIPLVT